MRSTRKLPNGQGSSVIAPQKSVICYLDGSVSIIVVDYNDLSPLIYLSIAVCLSVVNIDQLPLRNQRVK